MTRIALDAMGGDFAPENPVAGAVDALAELPSSCEILLVGREADVAETLARHGSQPERIRIVDAPEIVEMSEKPLAALRGKRKSSISVGLALQKDGEADAFISAGNTGAVMAASRLLLGLHPGVERAAIGALFPTVRDPVMVLDAGANVDCSPKELLGFAQIGAVYARDVLGRANPRVGLLNIGEEEEKGDATMREAYGLLSASGGFDFVGNVEGGDILKGKADIVVCDGFVGNVLLKFYESFTHLLSDLLELDSPSDLSRHPALQSVFTRLDYSEYGGAPLLGVKGVSIICHGRSPARAIKNAIRVAVQAAEKHLSQHIRDELATDGGSP